MKKLLKIVSVIILIPVVLIVGIIGFLKFADLNSYKPKIEQMVNKYAGINIKINGNLDIGVSLKPSIELNDVDISKPEDNAKIAHIGSALAQFSIMPLFRKEFVVDTIETENTDIFTNDKNSVKINSLTVSMDDYISPININLDTDAAGINIELDAVISSLQEIKASNYNNTNINADVKMMGYSINFNGVADGLRNKINIKGNYNINRKKTSISGEIAANMDAEIPYVDVKASSDEISVNDFMENKQAASSWLISEAYAEEYIPNTQIPYEYLQMVDADITIDVKKIVIDKNIVLDNVKADANLKNGVLKANVQNINFQKNAINGRLEITSPKTKPYIKLNIKGDGFDINQLQNTVSGKKKAELKNNWLINDAYAAEFIPNQIIPYEYLNLANADINVVLKKIKIQDITLNDINMTAILKNNVLNSNIENITAGNGKIKGNIKLDGVNKSLALNIIGTDIILQQLYPAFANSGNKELYIHEGGKTTININIDTKGKDTNQYLNNLNGQVISFVDPSVIQIKSLEKLKGNILVQILNTIKIPVTNEKLKLSCAVVRGDISNGLIKFPKGIVFDAKDFYLVADGKVNLVNDKINLNLQPFSGKIKDVNISSILGNLIKITGTINNPKIGINQEETAKNVIGAIASGGVYNVGDLMLSADSSPCHTALLNTAYVNHFQEKKTIGNAVSKGYTSTKDNIKDLGKGISNQAKDIGKQIKGLFK